MKSHTDIDRITLFLDDYFYLELVWCFSLYFLELYLYSNNYICTWKYPKSFSAQYVAWRFLNPKDFRFSKDFKSFDSIHKAYISFEMDSWNYNGEEYYSYILS